jgi:type IV pilus assembly protein PilW
MNAARFMLAAREGAKPKRRVKPARRVKPEHRGMTLIELMVAMAIGLGVMLAVTTLLIAGENHKRVTTSTNDAEQTGAYAFHALDGLLRGAGSAIAESAYPTDRGVLGCLLNAAQFLPRTVPVPTPFFNSFLAGATNTLVVAPLLIAPGQSDGGSDVLVVMGGSGAAGGVSRQVTGGGSATSMTLDNAVGFSAGDVALVSQSGVPECLLEEVNSVAAPTLNVGATTYYTLNGVSPTAPSTNLTTLVTSTSTYVTPLGNAAANNVQFELIGVGTDRTLYSYDLLQNLNLIQNVGGDVSQAIADGVDSLHAIYGVDSTGAGLQQNAWASAGVVAGDGIYSMTSVMASPNTMHNILAVRVALVLRGQYYDKNIVTPATLTLFSGYVNAAGNSLQQTINLTVNDQHYRYRVFEFTVPLRNMLLLAGA